jgi:hypothetical protein
MVRLVSIHAPVKGAIKGSTSDYSVRGCDVQSANIAETDVHGCGHYGNNNVSAFLVLAYKYREPAAYGAALGVRDSVFVGPIGHAVGGVVHLTLR